MAGPFVDQSTPDLSHISFADTIERAPILSSIHYTLRLYLLEGNLFSGRCLIQFYSSTGQNTWLDFSSLSIHSFAVNETVKKPEWSQGKIQLNGLYKGENRVEVVFTSRYRRDGTGLCRVIDPADGEQYLFSQFESDFAHMTFPCFDQPDLKAVFLLEVVAPEKWKVLSNELGCEQLFEEEWDEKLMMQSRSGSWKIVKFNQTKRISTYLFAVCAGPFTEVINQG